MAMEIIKPGLQTTVQDLGRFGLQQYGVIVSGAMDENSYRIANLLLQQNNTAVLEFTLIGPAIHFTEPTVIVLTGADFSPVLNDKEIPMWRPVAVQAGDQLNLGAAKRGARGYLAVQDGLQIPPVLNSASTYLRAGLGGYEGRALKKGDILSYKPVENCSLQPGWSVDYTTWTSFEQHTKIRAIKGTEIEQFDANSIEQFTTTTYTVTKDADRMGYRLESTDTELTRKEKVDILSEAVTFGTVQVPPNGQPIILMADRQTTGGYPKIAQVATVDLPKLAQMQPNQTLQFVWISLEQAQQLMIEREKLLKKIEISIGLKMKEEAR